MPVNLREDLSTFTLSSATLNRLKSVLFERNGIKLLGYPRRYKHYANAPQYYFVRTLPVF